MSLKISNNWDDLHDWYTDFAGNSGSAYHSRLLIPYLTTKLQLTKGTRLLDIGCGPGILLNHLQQTDVEYTGIDISSKMLATARHEFARLGHFIYADITSDRVDDLPKEHFDIAVFLLSLQDIADYQKALRNTYRLLKPDGKVVILILHPAFRIPRQSGWKFDENRKLASRRVDSYISDNSIPLGRTCTGRVHVFHHRPLSAYTQTLYELGYKDVSLDELTVDTQDPILRNALRKQPASVRKASQEIPLFAALVAEKHSSVSG